MGFMKLAHRGLRYAHSLVLRKRVDRPLLFLHLPKTAGTSVISFLADQVPPRQCFHIDQIAHPDPKHWLPRRPAAVYAGHVGYGFRHRLPDNTIPFTILRDPIERALSAYYFYRRQPRADLRKVAPYLALTHEHSFAEFIRRWPDVSRAAFGNVQTAILSWSDAPFTKESVWAANLAVARDNLAKCLVGLTERLTDSLSCLCRDLGWPPPRRIPQDNRTSDRPSATSLDPQTRAWLEEHTSLDSQLYRFGQHLFLEWAGEQGK